MSSKALPALAAAVLAGLAIAATATAGKPTKATFTDTGSQVYPAGTRCDFALKRDVKAEGTVQDFLDKAGNVVREQVNVTYTIVHTNLDTGYVLTETDRLEKQFTDAGGHIVGIFWNLRDASGKLVTHEAGQIRINFETGDFRVTPGISDDEAAVECEALGGHEA